MQLVIDISKEYYDEILAQGMDGSHLVPLYKAIANGTLLPKGHGDLKDADKLKHAFIKWSMAVQGSFTNSDIASIVDISPTIIEADKAE